MSKRQHEHLPRAPIIEAMIDLRSSSSRGGSTDSGSDRDVESLVALHRRIRSEYPHASHRKNIRVQLGRRVEVRPGQRAEGFFFSSADGRQVVQARLDGFAFSRLKPYQDWSHLRAEAKRLWHEYVDIAHPVKIRRVAVRYTNRIQVPLPLDTSDYFRTGPVLPPTLPQDIAGLYMRVTLVYPDNAVAVVTQGIDPQPPVDGTVAFLFDIEVWRAATCQVNTDEPWRHLDRLREIKNEIFFESVTSKALEMFR